jgi:hypothetical protein
LFGGRHLEKFCAHWNGGYFKQKVGVSSSNQCNLTPLSTHWAKIKKGTVFFGHPALLRILNSNVYRADKG